MCWLYISKIKLFIADQYDVTHRTKMQLIENYSWHLELKKLKKHQLRLDILLYTSPRKRSVQQRL